MNFFIALKIPAPLFDRLVNFQDTLADRLIQWGIKLLYCIIALFICFLFVRIARWMIHRFFNSKISNSRFMDERKSNTLNSISYSVIKYILYFFCIYIILSIAGVPTASLVTFAGVGSVAIGLGAQSLVQDVISGFFILFEDSLGVGDTVTIENHTGTVESINLRTTHLRALDGTLFIIPNGQVKTITNMSKGFMNAVVLVDVDYDEDIDRVLAVLRDEMTKAASLLSGFHSAPVVQGIVALNESAVTIRILAECEVGENYRLERELLLLIKKRLDKEKITIPYPQRTIHIVQETKKEEAL